MKPRAKWVIARGKEFTTSHDYLQPHYAEFDAEILFSCRSSITANHACQISNRQTERLQIYVTLNHASRFQTKTLCETHMRAVSAKYSKLYRSHGEVARKEKMAYGIDSLKLAFCRHQTNQFKFDSVHSNRL